MPRWGYEDRSIPDNDPAVQSLQPNTLQVPSLAESASDHLAGELGRARSVLGSCNEQQRLAQRILTEQARGALAEGPEAQRQAAAELKRALDLTRAGESDLDASRRLHELAHQRSTLGYDHMVLSKEAQLRLQPS